MDSISQFGHPAFRTGIGTALGYGVIIAAMFLLLFVVPYLFFLSL